MIKICLRYADLDFYVVHTYGPLLNIGHKYISLSHN